MTEESTLEQTARQGSAIERYEGPLTTPACIMYRPRGEFLSSACFAAKQDRAVCGRDQVDLIQQGSKFWAAANHVCHQREIDRADRCGSDPQSATFCRHNVGKADFCVDGPSGKTKM